MTQQPLPAFVQQTLEALGQPQPMRRGSLAERYVKCSKANCACQQDPEARHGPYYSWTRVVKGKTRSRFVTVEQAPLMRAQLAAGQKFRQQVERHWAACEQWADRELESPPAAAEAAEKKGSRRRSKMRSARNSKHS
jgi:hypothetical protein